MTVFARALVLFSLVASGCATNTKNVGGEVALNLPQGWSEDTQGVGRVEHSCEAGVEHCEAVTMAAFRDPLSQGDRGAVYKLCNQREGNLNPQEFAYRLTKEMQLSKNAKVLADDVRSIGNNRRGRVVVYEPFAGYRRYVWFEYSNGIGWKVLLQDVESSSESLQKPFETLVRGIRFETFSSKLSGEKCKAFAQY